jgi:hypothetical protein
VASADAKYQGIPLGGNEPEGRTVGYVRDQGVMVTVIDDDGGCSGDPDGEFMCYNAGECAQSAADATSACLCKKGFGMQDCKAECSQPFDCAFRSLSHSQPLNHSAD